MTSELLPVQGPLGLDQIRGNVLLHLQSLVTYYFLQTKSERCPQSAFSHSEFSLLPLGYGMDCLVFV